eukprot:1195359-Prorocentrum_minimum.AAC.2
MRVVRPRPQEGIERFSGAFVRACHSAGDHCSEVWRANQAADRASKRLNQSNQQLALPPPETDPAKKVPNLYIRAPFDSR